MNPFPLHWLIKSIKSLILGSVALCPCLFLCNQHTLTNCHPSSGLALTQLHMGYLDSSMHSVDHISTPLWENMAAGQVAHGKANCPLSESCVQQSQLLLALVLYSFWHFSTVSPFTLLIMLSFSCCQTSLFQLITCASSMLPIASACSNIRGRLPQLVGVTLNASCPDQILSCEVTIFKQVFPLQVPKLIPPATCTWSWGSGNLHPGNCGVLRSHTNNTV